jgi:hypothetical protein
MSFLTNFKPSNFFYLNNFNFFKIRKNSKIILRNFFLFLFLLKYLNNKNNIKVNQDIWIKPIRKKAITILKAPYKNKLARNQLLLKRFFFLYRLKLILNTKLGFEIYSNLIAFINFFKNFNFFIESSLSYQYKTKINFSFYFNNFFKI